MGGKLLGSFVGESDNVRGLLEKIRAESAAFFGRILPRQLADVATEEPLDTAPKLKAESKQPQQPQESVVVENLQPQQPQQQQPSPFANIVGFTAKAGFAKTGVKDGKSGLAYSLGLLAVINFGFMEFVPELLVSIEEYEFGETEVNNLNFEIPLTARILFTEDIGLSLGVIAGIPLSSKFGDYENPKDLVMFGVAATGGLVYKISKGIFVNASYIKYFTEHFTSEKNSKMDKVLCGIGYLL
jgi:hypothetical protein